MAAAEATRERAARYVDEAQADVEQKSAALGVFRAAHPDTMPDRKDSVLSELSRVPGSDHVLAVVVIGHAGVVQDPGVDQLPGVPGEHIKPNHVHAHSRSRVLLQDLASHPTGALGTGRSSGREQQDQAGMATIPIESFFQLVDALQIAETRTGTRGGLAESVDDL